MKKLSICMVVLATVVCTSCTSINKSSEDINESTTINKTTTEIETSEKTTDDTKENSSFGGEETSGTEIENTSEYESEIETEAESTEVSLEESTEDTEEYTTEAEKETELITTTEEVTQAVPTSTTVTEPTTIYTEPTTEAPVIAVSLDVSITDNHFIGDNLTANDITVKVNMSNGTVLTNPAGWSASTLYLASDVTNITISYGGVSKTVIINAVAKPTASTPTEPVTQPRPTETEPTKTTEPITQPTIQPSTEPVTQPAINEKTNVVYYDNGDVNLGASKFYQNDTSDEELMMYCYNSREVKQALGDDYYLITSIDGGGTCIGQDYKLFGIEFNCSNGKTYQFWFNRNGIFERVIF